MPLQRSSHRLRYLNEHDPDISYAVTELNKTKKKKAWPWVETTWSTRSISSLFLLVVAETHVIRGVSAYRTLSALETPAETPLDGAQGRGVMAASRSGTSLPTSAAVRLVEWLWPQVCVDGILHVVVRVRVGTISVLYVVFCRRVELKKPAEPRTLNKQKKKIVPANTESVGQYTKSAARKGKHTHRTNPEAKASGHLVCQRIPVLSFPKGWCDC